MATGYMEESDCSWGFKCGVQGRITPDLETGHPHSGMLVGHRGEQRLGQGLWLLVEGGRDSFSQLDAAVAALLEEQV